MEVIVFGAVILGMAVVAILILALAFAVALKLLDWILDL